MREKNFILARQPHETLTHSYAWSPSRNKPLFASVVLLLLMGLSFPNALDDHLSAVKLGLTRIALGQKIIPHLPQSDAKTLLSGWYGIKITCTEPTEKMWQTYCQSMHLEKMALNCASVLPKDKEFVMNNMRVCHVG